VGSNPTLSAIPFRIPLKYLEIKDFHDFGFGEKWLKAALFGSFSLQLQ
jgi:hypothetical protein